MIKKINEKFKQWLLKYLGLYQLRQDADLILKSLNIGVDVHYKVESWAVICIDGNPCYIKFIRMPNKELRILKEFLSQYKMRGSNILLDDPPGYFFNEFKRR